MKSAYRREFVVCVRTEVVVFQLLRAALKKICLNENKNFTWKLEKVENVQEHKILEFKPSALLLSWPNFHPPHLHHHPPHPFCFPLHFRHHHPKIGVIPNNTAKHISKHQYMFCIWINYQSARIGGFTIIGWMHVESNWKCSHIHVEIWYIP